MFPLCFCHATILVTLQPYFKERRKRHTNIVSVRIEEKGKTTVGQAADTDTLVASANAYLSALNKLIIKRKKTAPDHSLSAQI